jgi:hypothetical protein
MCADSWFACVLQVLEAMWDDSCSLVLTPQAFSNINPKADIFNNINQQFWEYVLPGCDALGYIACTGTNFCLRARSLAQVRALHSADSLVYTSTSLVSYCLTER